MGWMEMRNERLDECVATLDQERMAIEIIFRLREGAVDHVYWVTGQGESGPSVLNSDHALDIHHLVVDEHVRDGGWVYAEPQLLPLA